MIDQYIVFGTLILALILFVWGFIRHDLVALICLIILVIFGITDPMLAFTGFGHPAVITVIAVLIISKGFENSGVVELIGGWIERVSDRFEVQLMITCFLVALMSAFMNDVGALAIIMPMAIVIARRSGKPASTILIPVAFSSLLGGMITLIGTPSNIIIATFRNQASGNGFSLFDFTPVGGMLTALGVGFIALWGWRLVPEREVSRRTLKRYQKLGNEIRDQKEKRLKLIVTSTIFLLAVILVVFGILPVQISFVMAAVIMIILNIISIDDMYESIDWPVVVLLGAMIPVGMALETTGGALTISQQLLKFSEIYPPWVLLSIIMMITMTLSGVMNNAATVVLMAPISIAIAKGLGVSIDPFLMAVAIGGSASFLTPIGHQSNTLVMGPGGYKFTDYLLLGIPMSILVLIVGVPVIMIFWPL